MAVKGAPKSMVAVANQIATDCAGKLDMLVATHRHTDHISGFVGPSGKIIQGLDPALVVQPWTERPDLAPDATGPAPAGRTNAGAKGLVAALADMHSVAEYLARSSSAIGASHGVPTRLAAQLQFLGETNIKNKEAVEMLAGMGGKHVYVNFGSKLPTARLLPGVKIDVLGPPTVDQSKDVTHETARRERVLATRGRHSHDGTDPLQRFALPRRAEGATAAAGSALGDTADRPDGRRRTTRDRPHPRRRHEQHERDPVVRRRRHAAAVPGRRADRELELRPQRARRTRRPSANGSPARECTRWATTAASTRRRRRCCGATSRTAAVRRLPDRLITVVSTLAGKHGDRARNTEVPRRTLVAAMENDSDFHTTESGIKRGEFWQDVSLAFAFRQWTSDPGVHCLEFAVTSGGSSGSGPRRWAGRRTCRECPCPRA